jgi:beta-N-acetylhexosaminidase
MLLEPAGPELAAAESRLFTALQPAGFVLKARNLVSASQTRRLTDTLRKLCRRHPIIALRITGGPADPTAAIMPTLPTAAALAAHGDPKTLGLAGLATGELLGLLGVNLNLGPLLDLDGPAPAGDRWGTDPQRVIDHAGQWNRWLRKRGVSACAGCIPAGCGSRHRGEAPRRATTIAELLRRDLLPYTALMPELDALMVGHTEFTHIDPGVPASLSPLVVRRLLRDQLGFDHHVVLTDELPLLAERYPLPAAARMALEAGVDLVLGGGCHDTAGAVAEALAALPASVRNEAWERVERLRDRFHWPLPWAEEKWQAACARLAA